MPLYGEERREFDRRRSREKLAELQEIGPPPDVVDPERRKKAEGDLLFFLVTYFAPLFSLKFSEAHYRLIGELQECIIHGQRIVVAMPRGSGKTTIMTCGLIWAILAGHRRFPMIVTADDPKFNRLLRGIKTQLETNTLLLDDFPEAMHPIAALERVAIRANNQKCDGEPTYIKWGSDHIALPTTAYTVKAGNASAVIAGGGLTSSAVRGAVFVTPTGESIRPDAVLVDDPQTRGSAKSETQTQDRWDILNGDLPGMAGPGKDMAMIVTCTVIYEDDLAERLLDPERSPTWRRHRVQMIQSWPTDMDSWDVYAESQREESAGEIPKGSAHRYYLGNQAKLDAGSEVYWEERKKPGFATAIESAMSDYLTDPRSFLAEYQNQPTQRVGDNVRRMDLKHIVKRINGYPKRTIPQECSILTAHIDVQATLLFWMVCAFTDSMGCYVVDYGTTPEQPSGYFTLKTARRTFRNMYPDADETGSLRGAIRHTVTELNNREFIRPDGVAMRINRGLVDAGYSTDDVEAALTEVGLQHWMPSFGVGIKATANPLHLWTKRPGAIRGDHWLAQKPAKRNLVSAFIDSNHWKTDAARSLVCDPEHTQATTLFQAKQSKHQLIAEHFCSEFATTITADNRGKVVEEWEPVRRGQDNHWWDNFYSCRAAASMSGVRRRSAKRNDDGGRTKEDKAKQPKRKRRVKPLTF